jgi:tape measure domain-containing protein
MALFGSSDESIGVRITTSSDTKGVDQTTTALSSLERGAGLSAKSAALMGVVAGVTQTGIIALGGAFKAAGSAAIGGASSFEQNRVAFETMLGSADKARSLLTQISKFAKETPFELPEVVAGSKQLLAYGFTMDQIIPTMRKLGDIASGVGVPVSQLTTVFGQVRTAGKLMGGDILQFTNAGVPIIEALAKVLHVTQGEVKDMVAAGKVGFPEVQAAIDSMSGAGSQFGGMMDKQSHTFGGVVSNIKDGFGQILRGAVGVTNAGDIIKGGLFDRLKDGAQAVMPVLQRLGEQAGPAMEKAMSAGTIAVKDFIMTFKDPDVTSNGFYGFLEQTASGARRVYDAFVKYLSPSLKALWNTLKTQLAPSLKQLIPYIDDVAKIIGAGIIVQVWLAVNALNFLVKTIADLIQWFFDVKKAVGDTVDSIATAFRWVGGVWNSVISDMATAIQAVWNAAIKPVVDLIVEAANIIGGIYGYIFSIIRGAALVAWWAIYNEAVSPVMNAIGQAANWVGGLVSGVWNAIAGAGASAWSTVQGWAVGAWQSIYNVWAGVAGWFGGIWNSIAGAGASASGAVGNAFAGVANGIKNAFKDAINWVIDKINALIHSMNSTVGKLPGVGKIADVPKFENGVQNFGGGLAVVGDVNGRGGELINLPRGSSVYSNQQSKQILKDAGGGTTFNHYGDVVLSTDAAVNAWYDVQGRNSELAQRGLTTLRGAI